MSLDSAHSNQSGMWSYCQRLVAQDDVNTVLDDNRLVEIGDGVALRVNIKEGRRGLPSPQGRSWIIIESIPSSAIRRDWQRNQGSERDSTQNVYARHSQ